MARPNSFQPYQRVTDDTTGKVVLQRGDGSRFEVDHVVTDVGDGVTDDDLDFAAAEEWAESASDD